LVESGETAALSHEWDDGIQTVKPTEKTKGVKTYTCKRCGVTRAEDIPPLTSVPGNTSNPPPEKIINAEDPPKVQLEMPVTKEKETPPVKTLRFAAFINGYSNNTFRGSNTMSKEEFVNILFKLKNPESSGVLPQSGKSGPLFNDVTPGRWSYNAIMWAANTGIIEADANGNFLPAAPVTRAGIAVMLARAEGWTKAAENTFRDIDSHPQRDAILMAVEAGVFRGYPDGTFRPDNDAIRVEVVTAMIRYLLGCEPTDAMWKDIVVSFVDISRSHWAYKYLALATVGYTALPVLSDQLSK
jgi:hypothetical protein